MDKFQDGQRVMVRKTEDEIILAPPEPGTVRRIKISGATAHIELDVRVAREGVHRFPATDSRARYVLAYPEDCDPMNAADSQQLCFVPVDRFGRDHHSTLLYIETRCVDHGGKVIDENLRCDPKRHPGHGHNGRWDPKYGTRLVDNTVLSAHDDWDCIDDLEAAGLIERHGSTINPIFRLTTAGYAMASTLRRDRAERVFAKTAEKTASNV
jgi:hypothetical protein